MHILSPTPGGLFISRCGTQEGAAFQKLIQRTNVCSLRCRPGCASPSPPLRPRNSSQTKGRSAVSRW